ncbi:MAG: SEL1-like repeat protein [Erythrobacter sp.]
MAVRFSFFLALTTFLVTGCVPSQYMGISTRGPVSQQETALLDVGRVLSPMTKGNCTDLATDLAIKCEFMPLNALAMASATGSKHAQLELGKRFEDGRGVELDLEKAEKLYKRASQTTGGAMSTCVWNEHTKTCTPIIIDLPYDHGLAEATERLTQLRMTLAHAEPTQATD